MNCYQHYIAYPLDRSDRIILTQDMDLSPYNGQISADSTVYILTYLNVPYQVTYTYMQIIKYITLTKKHIAKNIYE